MHSVRSIETLIRKDRNSRGSHDRHGYRRPEPEEQGDDQRPRVSSPRGSSPSGDDADAAARGKLALGPETYLWRLKLRRNRQVRTRMPGGVGDGVSNDPGYPIWRVHLFSHLGN